MMKNCGSCGKPIPMFDKYDFGVSYCDKCQKNRDKAWSKASKSIAKRGLKKSYYKCSKCKGTGKVGEDGYSCVKCNGSGTSGYRIHNDRYDTEIDKAFHSFLS